MRIVRDFLGKSHAATVSDITVAAIESYLSGLLQGGTAYKTMLNAKGAISRFCKFLKGRGLLAANPCWRPTPAG